MNRQIEILAPAGSYESMRAAMNAGSDAVYIGGNSFGARAYANNLDEETLLRAIDEAHIRDKRLYLTVNTLIKENEMKDRLYQFLERFYLQGLDAVIVQDVGAMHFIHHNFPELPIHASTQTTLTMAQGADLLKETGVTRLVTARELSLKEIKTLRENTTLEIETFVHGALCYCYSGQCLMSSLIGGRSGNRGRCAQPCRMPYQFYSNGTRVSSDKDKYLLSPKDINTIALIPELIEAGINSFKIEGRMKRPEYSAGVAAVYRKYVNLYLELGKEGYLNYLQGRDCIKDMNDLQDLYNRGGFSEGYGKTYHSKTMMALSRPNHSGLYVGEVTARNGNQVSITLKENINAQDILEIRNRDEESGYEFTVKDSIPKGNILKTNVGIIPMDKEKKKAKQQPVQIGAAVYRTKNNELLNRLTTDYITSDQKQGIYGALTARLDEPLTLTLYYKDYEVTTYQDKVQAALKQPMTKEKLMAPILKLGDTPYYMEKLTIDMDEAIFVPVAWLNELRREAVQLLQEAVLSSYQRKYPIQEFDPIVETEEGGLLDHSSISDTQTDLYRDKVFSDQDMADDRRYNNQVTAAGLDAQNHLNRNKPIGFTVTVRTSEQFEEVLGFKEISSIYIDYDGFTVDELLAMAKTSGNHGINFYLILPHICRLSIYEKLKKDIVILYGENDISGFVAKNFEEVSLLKTFEAGEYPKKEIILDYNMYIFNQEAKKFWRTKGITHYTAPVELNSKELKALGLSDCDMMVYGYLPLMVSAQCLYESTGGCKKCKAGEQRTDHLIDRMGMKFYIQTKCNGCYNILYNGQCLSLLKYYEEVISLKPRNLRLDFTFESKEEVNKVLTSYVTVFHQGGQAELDIGKLTAGHFKRGVE